jgi:alcohol dehydrogenase YqhD (iron-dependent ADH family)
MSIEKVREYLKDFGFDTRIQEFSVSSATVELAAEALDAVVESKEIEIENAEAKEVSENA